MPKPAFAAALVAVAMETLVPSPAKACGGFFCNGAQPVAQTGEDIVFAVDGEGHVEAHVQIQYQGAAEDFAWVLPVPTIPEIELGVPELFTQLRAATVPVYQTRRRVEGTCGSVCGGPSAILIPDGGSSDVGSTRVVSAEQVGPYDVSVLEASDAEALFAWLEDHGYLLTRDAIPKLMSYIDDGRYFVAARLASGRTVGEIRPLILRYDERKPCLPIELTAISTTPDLPIRVFVLGSERARSLNYASTSVDLGDPALFTASASYQAAVSRAVDEAGGRAFVTEYAGPTPPISVPVPSLSDLVGAPPDRVAEIVLELAGVDPRAHEIARAFLIPPDDADFSPFRGCPAEDGSFCARSVHRGRVVVTDRTGLEEALEREIIAPRRRINEMAARYPQTTRFFTTLSAEEMDLDPIFELDPDVPEVTPGATADLVVSCSEAYTTASAPSVLILPDGTRVPLGGGLPDTDVCRRPGASGCAATRLGEEDLAGVLGTVMLAWCGRRRAARPAKS